MYIYKVEMAYTGILPKMTGQIKKSPWWRSDDFWQNFELNDKKIRNLLCNQTASKIFTACRGITFVVLRFNAHHLLYASKVVGKLNTRVL